MLRSCGPVTGLFHEYEFKLAQAHPAVHAVHRDVPHAWVGYRRRDGGHPRGAHIHKKEICHQSWRRLSRLERFDGLRPAYTRERAGLKPRAFREAPAATTKEFFPEQPRRIETSADVPTGCGAGPLRSSLNRSALRAARGPSPFDFNQKVRELCDEFGALLIFDEVVTGFRLGHGRRAGLFRRQTRPDGVRQMHHRRLPDGRRRGRAARM